MAKWSDHDINVLKEMYSDKPQEEIINALEVKRSWSAIKAKGLSLGIHRKVANSSPSIDNKEFKFHKHCSSNSLRGIIYEINDNAVAKLNDIQKLLINEIQRYCEENGKFPTERDMSNKNGYISRSAINKHFNHKRFTEIYKYIYRVKEKMPEYITCTKCKNKKMLNENFFAKSKNHKFGFKRICRECNNWEAIKRAYRKKGIIFEEFTDIAPEEWWEHYYKNTINKMPDFCYEKESIIRIVRHVVFNKLNIRTKEELSNTGYLNDELMKRYRIYYLYRDRYKKYEFIDMCFPEFNIKEYDMPITFYNDDIIFEMICEFISDLKLTIEDILEGNYTLRHYPKLQLMITQKFKGSSSAMFIWYFKRLGIMHPKHNREINRGDFKFKPNNYWDVRQNRINIVKQYCEDNGIKYVINDNNELKKWIYNNFRQDQIVKLFNYSEFYDSLYDVLVDAYPEIKENKILFKWEWHQWNKYDVGLVNNMLRELVFYRFKIDDPLDIPKYLTYAHLERTYPKFNKLLRKYRYNSYYEWAINAFPEYKHLWQQDDFNNHVARDGVVCDSSIEKDIYEFIKYDLKVKYIEAIGTKYSGEHIFILPEEHEDKWYCPDFVIRYIERNGCKIRLSKPVYIEYFGMYMEKDYESHVVKEYKKKTKRKNEFYSNIPDIIYIPMYPSDLKCKYNGIVGKLKAVKIIN